MSFLKSVRGTAGRLVDGFRSPSPTLPNRTGSPRPSRDERPRAETRASWELVEADSAFEDPSSPPAILLVTTPSRSPSPLPLVAVPVPTLDEPPKTSTSNSGPVGQLVRYNTLQRDKPNTTCQGVVNNNSNVNYNAPGGTIVNNNINNVAQIVSHDQTVDDMNMIEKC